MGKATSRLSLSSGRRRVIILAGLFLTWSFAFTTLSHDGTPPIHAKTTQTATEWLPVKKLTCTDTYWNPAKCGLNGENCPSPANQFAAFQCPANCVREGVVSGKPHFTGGDETLGKPLVIGGPIYRGDSYICPTAVHAGVIEDSTGGCGVVKFMGMTNSFPGSFGNEGIESIDVQTYFPLTFRFTVESDDLDCPAPAKDVKWALPFVSAAHTALVWKATSSSTIRGVWSLAVLYAHLQLRERAAQWLSPGSRTEPDLASDGVAEAPVPKILEPVIVMDTISSAIFTWATPVPEGVEGISMWVDDVERSRRYFGKGAKNVLKEGEKADSFLLQRTPQAFVDYIRFGYIKDGKVMKYSQPGIWFTNGTWTGIPSVPWPRASVED